MGARLYDYLKSKVHPHREITFERLSEETEIFLYAGDLPDRAEYRRFVGLSLSQSNARHIRHDVTHRHLVPDDSVDVYQSEDVFEHIPYELLPPIIDEIYRILKPAGTLRLSLPDYRCDILFDRSVKDGAGKIQFDPGGGGRFIEGRVIEGGHVWFPRYESVKRLLEGSRFKKISFLHYYDENDEGVTNPIDYSIGFVQRTPDHDERVRQPYRPLSIVVDCTKG